MIDDKLLDKIEDKKFLNKLSAKNLMSLIKKLSKGCKELEAENEKIEKEIAIMERELAVKKLGNKVNIN